MAESVKVIVRCRPMNGREMDMKCKNIVRIDDCSVSLENPNDSSAPPKQFTYDSAYASTATSDSLYNDICYSLVENVCEGYNGTIFAYGQTGCGKSHTMQGPDGIAVDPAQRGIISRSFDHIFEAISVATGRRYLALVSYLEIYNENIRDLLSPHTATGSLTLKELPNDGVIVQNLTAHAVHNARECDELLTIGNKNRMIGATLMNATSSRSHSIFTISLEQITTSSGESCQQNGTDSGGIRKGKLNLVDLAGSERQSKTGATGDRLKEATKINLSLSALGNVISALVDGRRTKHVPYRDSKLTRLLQDSLGGNTKTLMIACISPAEYNYDETLSTLRYASRAKNICNKPRINEDPKDAMLREYREEIMKLKQMLEGAGGSDIPMDMSTVERDKLRKEYEEETERLKCNFDAQRIEKESLELKMDKLREHYEAELLQITQKSANETNNNGYATARQKMAELKATLIGGECANDDQVKERRIKKKLAAERRLKALSDIINRIEQSEDRDLLQGHYASIEQELQAKNDSLKIQRQKIRGLEREINDLQSEFQMDRTDYLETIRRLEKSKQFYQQLLDTALPILRKDGRYWDPDRILAESVWNDDLSKWKLPIDSMTRLKLPPAVNPTMLQNVRHIDERRVNLSSSTAPGRLERARLMTADASNGNGDNECQIDTFQSAAENIAVTYFRPKRAAELIHQNRVINNWKDYTVRNQRWLRSPPFDGVTGRDIKPLQIEQAGKTSARLRPVAARIRSVGWATDFESEES